MNRYSLSIVSFLLLILPGLLLLDSGYALAAIVGIIEIGSAAAVSFLPSDRGKGVGRYFPFLIIASALMVSQGYFQRLFSLAPVVPSVYDNDIAFLLVFMVLGIFLSMTSGTGKSMIREMSYAGFDEMELKSAVSSFNTNMMIIGFSALILAVSGYLLISVLPQVSIGFFPAVITFGIIYLLLFRVIFSEKRKTAR